MPPRETTITRAFRRNRPSSARPTIPNVSRVPGAVTTRTSQSGSIARNSAGASQRDRRFELRLSATWLERYPLTAAALKSEIREWKTIGFELAIPALDELEIGADPNVE